MSQPFQHKVDHEGDTNENNRNNYGSQPENNNLVRNLEKQQDYKEDD